MWFSDDGNAATGGTSESATSTKSGDERGDDKEALRRVGEQRDAARSALKAAEEERDALRKKADDLENAGKTEMQRLQDAVTKLTSDLSERDANLRALSVKNALTDAATKAGAKYPALLVTELSTQVEVDKNGEITNATKLITDAKKTYPELFRVVDGAADGGKGRQDEGKSSSDMNRLLRQKAGYAG